MKATLEFDLPQDAEAEPANLAPGLGARDGKDCRPLSGVYVINGHDCKLCETKRRAMHDKTGATE